MDTTVILAQPRGSRLRADAVYVAWVGLESGLSQRTVDRGLFITIFSRGPSFFAPDRAVPRCSLGKQNAKKRPMARSILATKVWKKIGNPSFSLVSLNLSIESCPQITIAIGLTSGITNSRVFRNFSEFWLPRPPPGPGFPCFIKMASSVPSLGVPGSIY